MNGIVQTLSKPVHFVEPHTRRKKMVAMELGPAQIANEAFWIGVKMAYSAV